MEKFSIKLSQTRPTPTGGNVVALKRYIPSLLDSLSTFPGRASLVSYSERACFLGYGGLEET
jgi:hypothetical protein